MTGYDFDRAAIAKAMSFAIKAHAGQERKYRHIAYVVHPISVAQMVQRRLDHTVTMVEAALLHDVVEDTDRTIEDVRYEFGNPVAELVMWLTNPSKGSGQPRANRKAMDRGHLARAPRDARVIKLLDRLDNILDFQLDFPVCDDESFIKLYIMETYELVNALVGTDSLLENRVHDAARDLGEMLDGTYAGTEREERS